jgi:hypothetical protein
MPKQLARSRIERIERSSIVGADLAGCRKDRAVGYQGMSEGAPLVITWVIRVRPDLMERRVEGGLMREALVPHIVLKGHRRVSPGIACTEHDHRRNKRNNSSRAA